MYAKIKVTDDVTIFDILDNRDQGILNALVNKQTTQSVVTCVEGESGKHSWKRRKKRESNRTDKERQNVCVCVFRSVDDRVSEHGFVHFSPMPMR